MPKPTEAEMFDLKYGKLDVSDLVPGNPNYSLSYTKALNWVNSVIPEKDLKNYALSFLSTHKNYDPVIEFAPDYSFTVIGKISYLKNAGAEIETHTQEWLDKKIQTLINMGKAEKQKLIQAKALESAMKIELTPEQKAWKEWVNSFSKIEALIDDHKNYDLESNIVIELFKDRQLSANTIKKLEEKYSACLSEINLASSELKDSFVNIAPKEIKLKQKIYKSIVDQLQLMGLGAKNIKKTKKKRGVKATREAKIVSKFKFKVKDPDLGITSILPDNILGAGTLLVYDTKKKRVTLFSSKDGEKLGVSGTAITGFDDSKSITKTLRDAKTQLPTILGSTTKRIEVILKKNIKGKQYTHTGRLNGETLLLKIFK